MPVIALEELVRDRFGERATVEPAEMVGALVDCARLVLEAERFAGEDWIAAGSQLTQKAVELFDGYCPPIVDDHVSAEMRERWREDVHLKFAELLDAEDLGD